MTTALQPAKTIEERISSRIHESIGDLVTDDDLRAMVARGMEEALFKPRLTPRQYGGHDQAPSLVDATVTKLLSEKMEVAVKTWLDENPDRVQAAVTAAIQDGVAGALLNTLERRFGSGIDYAIQQLLSPGRLLSHIRTKLYLECTLDSDDSLYYWLSVWLAERPETRRSGSLRIVSGQSHGKVAPTSVGSQGDSDDRAIALVPGDGDQVFRYEGVRFWVSSSSEPPTYQGTRLRTVRIKMWKRHRATLERLLAEVAAQERRPDSDITKILVTDGYNWRMMARRRRRTIESVVLPGATMASLVRDAKTFLAAEDEYAKLGVPHRWGLLLEGPPGNGKSSLAMALAGELHSPLYVLSLGNPGLTDESLTSLMADVPRGSVVVAEDIDAIYEGRERQTENKLTFSGLLNAIDGPVASEGRILILTTNRAAVLDPALIRPGRIDCRIVLGNATDDQARRMWRRFGRPTTGEESFARWAADGDRSMAAVQQRLLEEREVVLL